MTPTAASRGFASDPLWQRAQACLLRGDMVAARSALSDMAGDDAHAHLLAAQLAWREDRVRDGARHALAAAGAAPAEAEALLTVAGVLLETGENVAARDCLDHAAVRACDDPRWLMQAGALHKRLGQYHEALAMFDAAVARGHASAASRFWRGEALLFVGRIEEAETELVASLAAAPARGRVAVPLVRLRRQTPDRNHLVMIEAGARIAAPGSLDQAAFEFARYKTFEDLGRIDAAWQALVRGNALMDARLHGEVPRHHAWLERFLAAARTPEPTDANRDSAGPLPIFIVGVARSGTTLLERMLGNHSRVAVAGELDDFGAQLHWMADTRDAQSDALVERLPGLDYAELGRRYLAQTQWRARGKAFYVDKQPPNWLLAAAIHAALPRAPILHLVRDPMDTCFSNWRAYFGDACAYSYDLAALAEYFLDYRRVMAHWHRMMPGAILDVPYSDLVRAPEATLRRVFAFCGLDCEPGCSEIARNPAPSATLSSAQVRAPLHDRAFGEWRRYAAQLAQLETALKRQRDVE